jgi:hypothetical protein
MVGMENAIYCKWDTLPIKHLGLPFGENPERLLTRKPRSIRFVKDWEC